MLGCRQPKGRSKRKVLFQAEVGYDVLHWGTFGHAHARGRARVVIVVARVVPAGLEAARLLGLPAFDALTFSQVVQMAADEARAGGASVARWRMWATWLEMAPTWTAHLQRAEAICRRALGAPLAASGTYLTALCVGVREHEPRAMAPPHRVAYFSIGQVHCAVQEHLNRIRTKLPALAGGMNEGLTEGPRVCAGGPLVGGCSRLGPRRGRGERCEPIRVPRI